jgi:hypothetical protein
MKCSVPDCTQPSRAKGWCNDHYHRAYRNDGDPLAGRIPRGEAIAYYLNHVDLDTDECITWPYSSTNGGRNGTVWLDGKVRSVHVMACERHHGPRPEGALVAHLCSNKLCFNRRHLAWKLKAVKAMELVLVMR